MMVPLTVRYDLEKSLPKKFFGPFKICRFSKKNILTIFLKQLGTLL